MKSLRGRFTVAGVGALLSVVVLLIALGSIQSATFTRSATKQAQRMVDQSIDQIILDTYGMVEAQGEVLDKINDQALATSHYAMNQLGPARLDHSRIETWKAVNQFSHEETTMKLPKMMLGDHEIVRNTDPAKPSAVVDLTHSVQGGVPTLWQRLPNGEGYIRLSTWVVKDGKRQIGTYIPRVQPDGKPNPVVAAVESGKTYRGVAFVLGKWLLAVYQPFFDKKGELIGMCSTSVEQEAASGLRKSFLGVKLGKRGKIYSLGTTGDRAGKFFISPGGTEDQVVALDRKDARGVAYIEQIVNKAKELEPRQIGTVRYLEAGKDGKKAEWHTARVAYFKPWDWVIVADAYDSDFNEFQTTLDAGRSRMLGALLIGGLVIIGIGIFGIRRWASRVSAPLEQMTAVAECIAQGDLSESVTHTGKDELGRLAESFRAMSGSLRDVARVATEVSEGHLGVDFTPRSDRDELGHAVQGMLHSLRTVTARLEMSANEVNVAGEEFARAADDSGKAANNVAENSTSLANAAVQASRDVEDLQGRLSEVSLAATEQVASATQAESRLGSMVKEIEEAAGEGEIMARTARDGTIAAARATEIMASIQAQTESARQQIVALDEKGRQIGDIVETIAAIAAQTNLLALNAAIEAARAGQQGRGFAVVAEEVRKLAEQSGAATDSISSLIEEVRSTVMRTVEAIMATTEQVTKGTAGAEETRSALIEIESTVASVASQLDRIRADSAEAAQAMANVSRAAVDNRRLLDEAQSRSQDVAQTVDKVASISQQTAASSEQLNASSEEVNASAQELRKMAAELHSITGLLSAKEDPSLKAAA